MNPKFLSKALLIKLTKSSVLPLSFLSCIKHKTTYLQGLEQMTIPVSKFSFIFYYHVRIDRTNRVKVNKEINLVNKSQLHVEGFT